MFDGLHRLLTCYIAFVQLSNFQTFECAMSILFCKSNKCAVFHEMAAKKCNKTWEDGEIEKLIDLYEENSCLLDIFDKSYQKGDVKEKTLTAIAKEFNVQIADIKAKWNAIYRLLTFLDKVRMRQYLSGKKKINLCGMIKCTSYYKVFSL